MGTRRPRASGLVFWLRAAEWPWWWLTHALGAYAVRTWRPLTMRALLEARAMEVDRPRPLAGGLPGETALKVGAVMAPAPPEGRRWNSPEWEYLSASLAGSDALAARYPELVSGEQEPKRSLGEWDFVLGLALGLRGEGSFAYWSISDGGAQGLARRLFADIRLRRQLAEDVLDLAVEELDARAPEALSRVRIAEPWGDGDACSLFMTGTV